MHIVGFFFINLQETRPKNGNMSFNDVINLIDNKTATQMLAVFGGTVLGIILIITVHCCRVIRRKQVDKNFFLIIIWIIDIIICLISKTNRAGHNPCSYCIIEFSWMLYTGRRRIQITWGGYSRTTSLILFLLAAVS